MSKPHQSSADSRLIELFGGPIGIELLNSGETVQAFRLDDPLGDPMPADLTTQTYSGLKIGGFNAIAGPVLVPDTKRQQLVDEWFDQRSYLFSLYKGCRPHWDAAFSFAGTGHELVVSFCFHCGDISVELDGSAVKQRQPTYYHSLGSLVVMRQLFPADKSLQVKFCME